MSAVVDSYHRMLESLKQAQDGAKIRYLMEQCGYSREDAERILHTTFDLVHRESYEAWLRECEEAQAKSEREAALKDRLSDYEAMVPPMFKGASVDDFKGTLIEPYISRVLSEDGPSWLLLGTNGVGKTRLAWALCREWCVRGESYQVTNGTRLTAFFRRYGGIDSDLCDRIDGAFCAVRHLVIDEVDKLRGSENDMVFFSYLVDRRYEHRLQTIVMGNKGVFEAREIVGASAYSRLTGDGALKPAYWKDEDRRRRE